MSSSNLVRITAIEESTYGVTPVGGNFSTVRFTGEELSGTPTTTESATIRQDRLSSGQVVTGLEVSGGINFELANDSILEKFFASAMNGAWVSDTPVNADLTITNITATATLTRAAGSFITDGVQTGDFIVLTGFSTAGNNTQVLVTEVTGALTLTFIPPSGMANEVATGNTFKIADKLEIGSTKKSFTVEKAFTDLTNKAINYRGMLVGEMSLSVQYGSIVNGSVSFMGNDHEVVEAAGDFATNGHTIDAADTTQSLNGSVDMPIMANNATGTFTASDFCIQNIELTLNNNLGAQNCIGRAAPEDYRLGTASVSVSLSAYLSDAAWAVLGKKLTQESFSIAFQLKNADGWYGFYLPAVQVSFPDPNASAPNADVVIEMEGQSRVGLNGEKSLYIYRS